MADVSSASNASLAGAGALLLALTGCTASADGGSTDEASARPLAASTQAQPSPKPQRPGPDLDGPASVALDRGGARAGAQLDVLEDYLVARQTSVRAGEVTRGLVDTATSRWVAEQVGVVRLAERRGWSVSENVQAEVRSVRVVGPDALVGLCLWTPSADFVRRSDGRPARPGPEAWTPFDVTLVQVDGGWLVDGAAPGRSGCEDL